jgi:hypothetical protein
MEMGEEENVFTSFQPHPAVQMTKLYMESPRLWCLYLEVGILRA